MELKGDVIEMKYVVRLLGIEINNIKNVIHGEIEMPQNKKGSILGIYGANGSGKTVVVDCMVLLKYLLSGRQIPSNFYYYINEASDTSTVKYRFELKIEEKCYLVEYEIELLKNKHFVTHHALDNDFFLKENVVERLMEILKVQYPLNEFLNKAVR